MTVYTTNTVRYSQIVEVHYTSSARHSISHNVVAGILKQMQINKRL